ncbi:hypothetical protein V6N13_013886 [Hibiscus sabdariffa]|uniref:Uncharacterized protein n=1 Tax=Hibiscus sabdariffa TaxID=183260 RepID=A0ABR2RU98_9ROSI
MNQLQKLTTSLNRSLTTSFGSGDCFRKQVSSGNRNANNATRRSQSFNMSHDLVTLGGSHFAIHGEVLAIVREHVVAAKPFAFEEIGRDLNNFIGRLGMVPRASAANDMNDGFYGELKKILFIFFDS